MAGFKEIIGLIDGYLRLGYTGVRLKDNSGKFDVRDAGDSAYANAVVNAVEVADPATPARRVTLSAPTLAAGYGLTLPNAVGSAEDILTRSGASATAWARPTSGACGRRVDLDNAYPSIGNQSNIVKLYSYSGNKETLWNQALQIWQEVTVSTKTLDFSSVGNQTPYMPQDIFEYYDAGAGASAVAVVPWQTGTNKTITGITNASPPVLTVGSGHGFSVGDSVVVQDVVGTASILNNDIYRISATTSTTVSLQTPEAVNVAAPGTYTSGGKLWKVTPTTTRTLSVAYDTSQGWLVADLQPTLGGTGALYGKLIATVAYGAIKNQIADTTALPFMVNMFNRVEKPIGGYSGTNTSDSWSVQSTADTPTNSRAQNNSHGAARQWFLLPYLYSLMPHIRYRSFVIPPGVASENTAYVLYLSRNAIANFSPGSGDFSPPAVLAHVQGSAANSGDRYNAAIETEFTDFSQFGLQYLNACEFVNGSGANSWTVFRNFAGGSNNQYTLKGGYSGSYPR